MIKRHFLIGTALLIVPAAAIAAITLSSSSTMGLLNKVAQKAGISSAAAAVGPEITLSSPEELKSVLPDIAGRSTATTIRLKQGIYPEITIQNIKARAPVTIISVNQASPAVIQQMTVRGSSNIRFQNINFHASERPVPFPFLIVNSDTIAFGHNNFTSHRGADDIFTANAVLFLRNSNNINVSDNDFSNSKHGLSILNIDQLKIYQNHFHNLQTDGIRGGGITNATIEGNSFTDFFPKKGDHPDAIQIWSAQQTKPGRNIIVRNNLIVRGAGKVMQGIFIHDNSKKLPFEDIQITGNMLIGTMYNGIAISSGNRVTIKDNDVIGLPDMKSWIRIQDSDNISLEDNRATQYLIRQDIGVTKSGNKEIGFPGKKKIRDSFNAWKSRNNQYKFNIEL